MVRCRIYLKVEKKKFVRKVILYCKAKHENYNLIQ